MAQTCRLYNYGLPLLCHEQRIRRCWQNIKCELLIIKLILNSYLSFCFYNLFKSHKCLFLVTVGSLLVIQLKYLSPIFNRRQNGVTYELHMSYIGGTSFYKIGRAWQNILASLMILLSLALYRPCHPIKPQKPFFPIPCNFPLPLQLHHYNNLHALQSIFSVNTQNHVFIYIII